MSSGNCKLKQPLNNTTHLLDWNFPSSTGTFQNSKIWNFPKCVTLITPNAGEDVPELMTLSQKHQVFLFHHFCLRLKDRFVNTHILYFPAKKAKLGGGKQDRREF